MGAGLMRNFRVAVMVALMAITVASLAGCGGDSSGSGATVEVAGGTPSSGASGSGGARPTLSDTGVGDLKLNMGLEKAKALGWVGKAEGISDKHVCDTYAGKRGVKDVIFTDDKLVIIVAGPKIRLDTGLGVGSTYQELHEKYGDRLGSDEGLSLQRVYLTAPGAPFLAQYRLGLDTPDAFRDSKIMNIALQSVKMGCYE
jgi:hypothetical protein